METRILPPLPFKVLNLRYLLSILLIKDRILRFIFVYDVDALYHAFHCSRVLDREEADYYCGLWYDNAEVSVVSRSLEVSATRATCSPPHYYGREIFTELPRTVASWMESAELGPEKTSYRRLDVEGHVPVGTVSFIIEETGNCPEFSFPGSSTPSGLLRVGIISDYSDRNAESKTLLWIFPNRWSHEEARTSILEKLKRTVRSMYEDEGHGLLEMDFL